VAWIDRRRATIAAAVIVGVALGTVGVLTATRWGIGASPDSAVYLGVARNLLAGRGLTIPFGDVVDAALTRFPPLYPGLLALAGSLAGDPLSAARWLQAGLYGANALLLGHLVTQARGRVTWATVVAAVLFVLSPSMFLLHSMAWSEPAFLLLCLSCLALLARFLRTQDGRWAAAAGISAGLACLTRYAGVALLGAGLLSLLIWSRGDRRRRARVALVFLGLGATPLGGWFLRNLAVAGTAADRVVVPHLVGATHAWQALDAVSRWLLLPSSTPTAAKAGAALLAGAVVLGALILSGSSDPTRRGTPWRESLLRIPAEIRLLGVFSIVYGLFLLASVSLVDANTPFDERLLSPLFVAILVTSVFALASVQGPGRGARLARAAIVIAGGLFSLLSLKASSTAALEGYRNGIGFNQLEWRGSPTLAHLSELPGDTRIYANAPEAVYLLTGRSAIQIPKRANLVTRQTNEGFQNDVMAMGAALAEGGGVIVYLRRVQSTSLPTEQELRGLLSLEPLYRDDDGAIYRLVDTP
jgi:4-amino-4-deoxy-L-arabinose transferase-like glycosyltransferase